MEKSLDLPTKAFRILPSWDKMKFMVRAGIILGVLFSISFIAFNNCSGGFKFAPPATSAQSASSQCRLKLIQEAKSQPLPDPTVCENAANYHCDVRRFRRDVGQEQKNLLQCPAAFGRREFCISVTLYNFDTTTQLAQASLEESLEGGAYNRDEVSCLNTRVLVKGIAVVTAEGADLRDALEKAITGCRERGLL